MLNFTNPQFLSDKFEINHPVPPTDRNGSGRNSYNFDNMNNSESLSTIYTDGDRSDNNHSVLSRRIASTLVFLVQKAHPVDTRQSRAAESIITLFVSDSSDVPFITPLEVTPAMIGCTRP